MADYVIATIKSWNINNCRKLAEQFPDHNFRIVTEKEELTYKTLSDIKPEFVFFPHWSWLIPEEVYEHFNCVVFHMTDLPFGRGGSPLQNLLVRGIYHTKITAIKVEAGLDTGDIYLKESLDISTGSADEIFSKISDIVFGRMIPRFIEEKLLLMHQEGEPAVFSRRRPEQSEIPEGLSQRQIYDYIRMLDGEGYPAAYTKCRNGKVYYRNARLIDGVVYAEAEFREER
ncbi:MAG: methionyl-tRNA formyltransferase [Lachnospiraceae bacterium]|jgi:methionyl-tRNA formyltransferase|nr:methionyl-tRNA formyltransferase [Lachnospiraceae bacterium]